MFNYLAYCLNLASEFELPGFREERGGGGVDVQIRRQWEHGAFGEYPISVTVRRISGGVEFGCPFGVKYVVKNGNEISIILQRGVDPEIVTLPLYGFVMAALMKQRGCYVLHASAVEMFGRAVAFIGEKEQGKSTLVASLLSRGHKLISDDVTALSINSRFVVALPGTRLVKLWPDALIALKMNPDGHQRLFAGTEKRNYIVQKELFCETAVELATIVFLAQSVEAELHSLSGTKKMLMLAGNNYLARYENMQSQQERKKDFIFCDTIIKNCQMLQLSRPRDIRLLDIVATLIEEEQLSQLNNRRLEVGGFPDSELNVQQYRQASRPV